MRKSLVFGAVSLLLFLPGAVFSQTLFAPATNYPAGPADGYGVVGADFDDDGDIDLADSRWIASGAIGIVKNNGDGVFLSPAIFEIEMGGELAAADLDGDGDIDLAARGQSSRIYVIKNNGDGSFMAPQSIHQSSGGIGIDAKDLDSDGDIDLVASDVDNGVVLVLKNNGNGTFGAPTSLPAGQNIVDVMAVDIDADGDLDIAAVDNSADSVSLWLNNGSGVFAFLTNIETGDGPHAIAGGDLDGDNDIDLAVTTLTSSNIRVFLNNGNGGFLVLNDIPLGSDGLVGIFIADYDGDGDRDIAAGTTGIIHIVQNDGSGTFGEVYPYSIGNGIPFGIFSADLDGDADMDLAFTGLGIGGIKVMINTSTPTTDVWPPATTGDFRFGEILPNSVQLLWTAPGDNGVVGTATSYDVRYSTTPITNENWDGATQVLNEPTPQSAGTAENLVVDGLTSLATYYFAMKSSDEIGNISGLSNVITTSAAFRCGDANRDGVYNILDILYMLSNLYRNGPPPYCQ